VLRLGGLLGWGPRDVIGFAETLTGHSWQRCGRTDLEVIRDEFLALRWVIRRKAVRRSACPPTPCAHVSTDYRHAAQN
jgi:hypothetical protein